MRVEAQKVLLSQVRFSDFRSPLFIEDIRTGRQHFVRGRGYFDFEDEFGVESWDGEIHASDGMIVLYDGETDSLEEFYDLLEHADRPSEFPRVETKADRKRRKKAEAAERRRQKRSKAARDLRAAKTTSSIAVTPSAHNLEGLRVMNVSEVADDES